MNNNTAKEPVTVLGIDLAKQSFQLHGVDEDGQVVHKKKLNRTHLSAFVANLSVCLIGLANGYQYPITVGCADGLGVW